MVLDSQPARHGQKLYPNRGQCCSLVYGVKQIGTPQLRKPHSVEPRIETTYSSPPPHFL